MDLSGQMQIHPDQSSHIRIMNLQGQTLDRVNPMIDNSVPSSVSPRTRSWYLGSFNSLSFGRFNGYHIETLMVHRALPNIWSNTIKSTEYRHTNARAAHVYLL